MNLNENLRRIPCIETSEIQLSVIRLPIRWQFRAAASLRSSSKSESSRDVTNFTEISLQVIE